MSKRIDVRALPPVVGTLYPPPLDEACRSRQRTRIGNAAGLTQFGVNLVRLLPGAWSSQRHWHTSTDELVYVLSGEVVLVTDEGEETLRAGDAAGFKANDPNGHHLQNRSAEEATFLEIGTRAAQRCGHVSRRRPALAASPAACSLHPPGRNALSEAGAQRSGHDVTHARLSWMTSDQKDARPGRSLRSASPVELSSSIYARHEGTRIPIRKGAEHGARARARICCPQASACAASSRRQADAASRTPGFHRPARNSNVLPRLPRQVARDSCGPAAQRRRAGACRLRDCPLARGTDQRALMLGFLASRYGLRPKAT